MDSISASDKRPPFPCVSILGLPVAKLRLPELLGYFHEHIPPDRATPASTCLIAYANANSCNLFVQDPDYRGAMRQMDLVYADGNGPRLSAWLLGNALPPRMTGADWIDALASMCAANGHRLFLLGGARGIARKAGEVLCKRHPDLVIAGTHHGYFEEEENTSLIELLNQSQADILILGMGSPLQELWMINHARKLAIPVIWGAGGILDYVSGNILRAPLWMRRLSLEWLGRMLIEPRRLMPRYLVGIPLFLGRSLLFALRFHLSRITGQTSPDGPV
jgi:N-acetylglucosaminyldiphosphoundecaprenol N-acetyl-beta-D-mannosaminyltransferase